MTEMRIGGYGAGGCTCTITACHLCPVHGDDKHLNHYGRARKAEQALEAKKWAQWIADQTGTSCPECFASVEGEANRRKHKQWHEESRRRQP